MISLRPDDYLTIGPIGSRHDFLTWCNGRYQVGCFNGTRKDFLAAVATKHGDNKHAVVYRAVVALVDAIKSANIQPEQIEDANH